MLAGFACLAFDKPAEGADDETGTSRNIDAAPKAKIALEALREQATARVFDAGGHTPGRHEWEVERLYAKIGELVVERIF